MKVEALPPRLWRRRYMRILAAARARRTATESRAIRRQPIHPAHERWLRYRALGGHRPYTVRLPDGHPFLADILGHLSLPDPNLREPGGVCGHRRYVDGCAACADFQKSTDAALAAAFRDALTRGPAMTRLIVDEGPAWEGGPEPTPLDGPDAVQRWRRMARGQEEGT